MQGRSAELPVILSHPHAPASFPLGLLILPRGMRLAGSPGGKVFLLCLTTYTRSRSASGPAFLRVNPPCSGQRHSFLHGAPSLALSGAGKWVIPTGELPAAGLEGAFRAERPLQRCARSGVRRAPPAGPVCPRAVPIPYGWVLKHFHRSMPDLLEHSIFFSFPFLLIFLKLCSFTNRRKPPSK